MIHQRAIHEASRPADGLDASIGAAIADLRSARDAWRLRQDEARDVASFPSRDALEQVVGRLSEVLYPRRLGLFDGAQAEEDRFVEERLRAALTALEREVGSEIGYWQSEAGLFEAGHAATIVRLFAGTLGDIRRLVDSDVEAAFLGDPAARSVDEILICYPGAIASLHHRIAHELHELGAPIVARLISELANERTGIDIHPGATIGERFFIDHGTGVVIGETAIVGAGVRLYQHVTLGARSPVGATRDDVRERHARHPIVGDDVVIYAGATILGRVTIGARSTIGGNVWLLSNVAADSMVVQPEAVQLDGTDSLALRDVLGRGGRSMSGARPIIGVLCCNEAIDRPVQVVATRFVAPLSKFSDATVVLIPAVSGAADTVALSAMLDGLLLTGSRSNVAPDRYGGGPLPAGQRVDPQRDEVALALAGRMIEVGKPVFGICRGLQEINVLFGGTLSTDACQGRHHRGSWDDCLDRQFEHCHEVELQDAGLLARATGRHRLRVNSVHEQGIDRLGTGLSVEAVAAEDGLVEAVSARPCGADVLAVQWHPEWDVERSPESRAFFALVGAALRAPCPGAR